VTRHCFKAGKSTREPLEQEEKDCLTYPQETPKLGGKVGTLFGERTKIPILEVPRKKASSV